MCSSDLWIGMLFSVSLGSMFFIWAKDMRLESNDREWLMAVRAYATRQKDGVPPAGKYNAGQKLFFWAMTVLGVVHLASGIPLWMPAGVLGIGPFYGGTVNTMRLLHYATTLGGGGRSEEHTSELQSRTNLVCRLLLEKKKNNSKQTNKQQKQKETN